MTRLVLIRHGEAQAYLDNIVAGEKGCRGLSDLGRRQATALHERLERTGELADTTALYASILPRAIETAAIIAPAIGGHEIEQDCDFCELHPGEADGMTWDDYRATYWMEPWDPERAMAPGGESFVGFVERVGAALRRLVERHPDDTVVIGCHGGVVMSSMFNALSVPIGDRKFLNGPENTSITEWQIDGDHWGLVRYNDHAHLADLPD
ncbi:MAG: ribonuclease / adenosylcobalamin/alpha-ribazole phosphatase [Actinomycetota bacterium]|jgi:probable phosphoglycerate mutase